MGIQGILISGSEWPEHRTERQGAQNDVGLHRQAGAGAGKGLRERDLTLKAMGSLPRVSNWGCRLVLHFRKLPGTVEGAIEARGWSLPAGERG